MKSLAPYKLTVGDKAAILLIVMKDMLENGSEDSYEQILGKYEQELKVSADITLFLQEFYKFAQIRSEAQSSWSEWKKQNK